MVNRKRNSSHCVNLKDTTKMTIFHLEVKATALDGLASSRRITNLCIHLCEIIFSYLHDAILFDNPAAQSEIRMQFTILKWYFRILNESACDFIESMESLILVNYISVNYGTSHDPQVYTQRINLDALHTVPVKILLCLITKLITESLVSLQPFILFMNDRTYLACHDTLQAMPKSLSSIVLRHLDIGGTDVSLIAKSEFFTATVNVEFCDFRKEVILLD